jgi:hypothetical protein
MPRPSGSTRLGVHVIATHLVNIVNGIWLAVCLALIPLSWWGTR